MIKRMDFRTSLTLLLLLAAMALPATEYQVLAGVNVVRPELNRVDPAQTVLVKSGIIVAVGATDAVDVPEGAQAIDARGHYLLPGLTEMHAHVPGDRRGQQYLEDVLFLWVANGITTVRNMAGAPFHLQLREQLERGDILGPRLITSGPRFAGKRLADIDAMVADQKAAGYDFLKVHMGLQADAYAAIMAAARKNGLTVAGHVDTGVGLERALAEGQVTIDHLDSYFRAMVPDDVDVSGIKDQLLGLDYMAYADLGTMTELAAETAAAGVWNVPTQTLPVNFIGPLDAQAYPELQYMPPKMRNSWQSIVKGFQTTLADPELAADYLAARGRFLLALHEAGAGILLGSDAPQMMNVPGFSWHKELALMIDAGLTPAAAITAGTHSPAVFFDATDTFGAIAPGLSADLVLTAANPLEQPDTLKQPLGVMVRGRWLPQAELQAGLAAIAGRNRDE